MRFSCISRAWLGVPFLASLALFEAGCATEKDQVDKQLARLHEQIVELQNDTDRMSERLDAVEARQPTPTSDQRLASAAPETVSRPKLKVVHLDPDDAAMTDAPAAEAEPDSGPRVVIQGEGKTIETRTLPATAKPQPKADVAPAPAKAAPKPDAAPAKK